MAKTGLFLFISLAHIHAQCVFPGLNISNLDGLTLECNFGSNYKVFYTPCNNQVKCPIVGAIPSMVIQETGNQYDCYNLAYWDPDIMPVLNKTANPIEYTFNYRNGATDVGCPNGRNISISYICDSTADPYGNITCGELTQPCNYYYTIKTNKACPIVPSGGCTWFIGNKLLNLTLFDENDVAFYATDATNNSHIIGLSPCRNGLQCTLQSTKKLEYNDTNKNVTDSKDGNAMAFLAEMDDLKCLNIIGTWNNGTIQPSYDAQNNVWQFIYEMPNGCHDGLTSVFMVYYTCNLNTFYTIESASTVTTCLYQMTIQTYLAC